jgi:hypothetical protein
MAKPVTISCNDAAEELGHRLSLDPMEVKTRPMTKTSYSN